MTEESKIGNEIPDVITTFLKENNALPCPVCNFIHTHCRCENKITVERKNGSSEPSRFEIKISKNGQETCFDVNNDSLLDQPKTVIKAVLDYLHEERSDYINELLSEPW